MYNNEMELEETMASLRINERNQDVSNLKKDPSDSESEEEGESLQKKRRVLTKPTKISEDGSLNCIESYYLDKRVKRLHPTLETIYEESKNETYISSRRFRRAINFSAAASKNAMKMKTKKRKMKAKHMTANKRVNNKKIPIKYLLEKLAEIKDE